MLDRLHSEGRQLSLVLADQALPEVGGTELLSRIRRLHPTAKRLLLVVWADETSQQAILGDLDSGATRTVGTAALYVLIGAEPRTQWPPEAVGRDRWGFVVTGGDLLGGGRPPAAWPLERLPMFLESSLPGVFAVGDVRHGSVKRVASAVGEGSIAIRLVHDHLRDG